MKHKLIPLTAKNLINRMKSLNHAEDLLKNGNKLLMTYISLISIIDDSEENEIRALDLKEKFPTPHIRLYEALTCMSLGDLLTVKEGNMISKGISKARNDMYYITDECRKAARYIKNNLTKLPGYESVFGSLEDS